MNTGTPDDALKARHNHGLQGAGAFLLRGETLVGLAIMVTNDHFLKVRFHNPITGKLSDVGGMLLLPLLAATIVDFASRLLRHRTPAPHLRTYSMMVVAIGVMFTLMKTTSFGIHAYDTLNSAIEWPILAVKAVLTGSSPWAWPSTNALVDPTDLWALLALVVAWNAGRRVIGGRERPSTDPSTCC